MIVKAILIYVIFANELYEVDQTYGLKEKSPLNSWAMLCLNKLFEDEHEWRIQNAAQLSACWVNTKIIFVTLQTLLMKYFTSN